MQSLLTLSNTFVKSVILLLCCLDICCFVHSVDLHVSCNSLCSVELGLSLSEDDQEGAACQAAEVKTPTEWQGKKVPNILDLRATYFVNTNNLFDWNRIALNITWTEKGHFLASHHHRGYHLMLAHYISPHVNFEFDLDKARQMYDLAAYENVHMNFNCYGLGNSTEEVLIPGGIYAVILKALPTTHATVPIYETLEIPDCI